MGSDVRIRVAVCVARNEQVLLVEHEKAGSRYWLLPGGGVEVGETLIEAAARELQEETGYACEVGRLVIVCEAVQPAQGRHIVNLVFAARLIGGGHRVGADVALRDVKWVSRDKLTDLEFYPPIAAAIVECLTEDLQGPVRYLGNVWRDPPAV